MYKKYLGAIILIFGLTIIQAQEETGFSKKGRWTIESGAGFLGLIGNSTGSSFLFSDGASIGTVSFEGGKFITENLAIQAKISHFTSGESFDVTTVGLGGKYYAGGVVPIKIGGAATISSGFGSSDTQFLVNASAGYAAKLAPNILMEPNIGVLISGEMSIAVGVTFALILGN